MNICISQLTSKCEGHAPRLVHTKKPFCLKPSKSTCVKIQIFRTQMTSSLTQSPNLLRLEGALIALLVLWLRSWTASPRKSLWRILTTWKQSWGLAVQLKSFAGTQFCINALFSMVTSKIVCAECGTTPFVAKLVTLQTSRGDGYYYCIRCWQHFKHGNVPTNNADTASFALQLTGPGKVTCPMLVTDLQFPRHHIMCQIHLQQLRCIGVYVADGVDVFTDSATSYEGLTKADWQRLREEYNSPWTTALLNETCEVVWHSPR